MESISKLREELQREKLEGRERPWGYRLFQRGPSIYLTVLLVKTPFKPNHITMLSILSGIAGSALMLLPEWEWRIAGLLLLYLHLLLDRVDGEVARYKKIYSLRGIYLDEINHLIVPPLFFLALGWSLAETSVTLPPVAFFTLAPVAALASVFLRITHNIPYQVYLKKYLKYREVLGLANTSPSLESIRRDYSFLHSLLRFCHQFQDFFLTITAFAIALTAERLFTPYYFLNPYVSCLYAFYTVYLGAIVFENILKGVLTIESRMKEIAQAAHSEDIH